MSSVRQPTQIAILAKAPIAGLAKTRLAPAMGAASAAQLQARLTHRAVQTALAAKLGPVHLWCTPDTAHPHFQALHAAFGVPCIKQVEGDLGKRMHAAFALHCQQSPLILIGTDSPVIQASDFRQAAEILASGRDAVFQPAEDGGYVLVGLTRARAGLFEGVPWSTAAVMSETRLRAAHLRLEWEELPTLWDVDEPSDLVRLRNSAQLSYLLTES